MYNLHELGRIMKSRLPLGLLRNWIPACAGMTAHRQRELQNA
jgi:hypothetical protein